MEKKKIYILMLVFSILLSWTLSLAQWYQDYESALQKLSDGQYSEALEKINQAIRRESEEQARKRAQSNRYISYFPYLIRGEINYFLGRYQESLADLEASKAAGAVFSDPDGKREWYQFSDWAMIKLTSELIKESIYWFNRQDFEKAGHGFRKALEIDSLNATSALFLKIIDGSMQANLNDLRLENKSSYELEEGKKLFTAGKFQESMIRFSIALAFDSTLGEARIFQQRAEKALAQIQQQLSQEGELSANQKSKAALLDTLNIGLATYAQGDYQKAEAILQLILERDPENALAAEFLKRCRMEGLPRPEEPAEETGIIQKVTALQAQLDSVNRNSLDKERTINLMEKLNRGLEAFAGNDYHNSVRILQEVLDEDPSLSVAAQYLELGRMAMEKPQEVTGEQKDTLGLRLGELKSRISSLTEESLRQRGQLELLTRINEGVSALIHGEFEHAATIFEKVSQENPEYSTAKDFLTLAREQQRLRSTIDTIDREYKTIQSEYDKLKVRMDSVAYSNLGRERNIALMEQLNRGLIAYASNDYETAIVILENLLKDDPAQNTAAEYLKAARRARTAPPQSVEEAETRSKTIQTEIDNLQDKLSAFTGESRSQQRQLAALKRMNEGLRALSSQEYGRAISLFRAVLEENPDMSVASEYLALAERQYSTAQDVKQAEENQTTRIQSEMESGITSISAGNYQEALLHFNVVQALDPGNVAAGRYAEQAKRELERIDLQRKMLEGQDAEKEKKMEKRKDLLDEALTLFTGQKFLDAQTALQKILETFPEDRQASDMLAECGRRLEQETEGKSLAARITEFKQNGMKYFGQGDFEKARDDLLVALAMEPGNEELKSRIAQCENNIARQRTKGATAGTFFHLPNLKRGMTFQTSNLMLEGVVFNPSGISQVQIMLNANKISQLENNQSESREKGVELALECPVRLKEGLNRLVLVCQTRDGSTDSTVVDSLWFNKPQGRVYAALFGVAEYEKVNKLSYTLNDVEGFKKVLENLGVPESQIFTLENSEVTASEMRSLLGSRLKNILQPEDQAIIYFSGHGGYEAEAGTNNADGYEKYLLPYNADPKDYYSTAYPMSDIANISSRLKAGQVFFIIDACYSGASGSKSFAQAAGGGNFSQEYLDRISNRNGRVILTASGPNEPSLESEAIKHGFFTYYLIEGLNGKADINGDHLVSINELNDYLAIQVSKSTNGRQNPVFKGSFSGSLILGKIAGY